MGERTKLLLLGAGHIGSIVAKLLSNPHSLHDVTVADTSEEALAGMPENVEKICARFQDMGLNTDLEELFQQYDVVVNTLPGNFAVRMLQAACDARVHYFDITEENKIIEAAQKYATGHATCMPQCGLAPGVVSVIAADMAKQYERIHNIKIRVGALPIHPTNQLKYNLTWSTHGLVNEYCNDGMAQRDGKLVRTPSLQEVEELVLDGVAYEAFNTSGGLGTLAMSLEQARNINYKTIRYPGHCELMRFLADDLDLRNDRHQFAELLDNAVPRTEQDVVLVSVVVNGEKGEWPVSDLHESTYFRTIRGTNVNRIGQMTAIQVATAFPLCAMVELQNTGSIPTGYIAQEEVPLEIFRKSSWSTPYIGAQ